MILQLNYCNVRLGQVGNIDNKFNRKESDIGASDKNHSDRSTARERSKMNGLC